MCIRVCKTKGRRRSERGTVSKCVGKCERERQSERARAKRERESARAQERRIDRECV